MSWLRRRPIRLPQDLPLSPQPPSEQDQLLTQLAATVRGELGGPAQVAPILWGTDLLKLPEITVKRDAAQYPNVIASGGWCAPTEVNYDHLL